MLQFRSKICDLAESSIHLVERQLRSAISVKMLVFYCTSHHTCMRAYLKFERWAAEFERCTVSTTTCRGDSRDQIRSESFFLFFLTVTLWKCVRGRRRPCTLRWLPRARITSSSCPRRLARIVEAPSDLPDAAQLTRPTSSLVSVTFVGHTTF